MPNNWKKYKLGELITLHYGKSLTAKKRIDGNIPVYSSAGCTGSHNSALVQSEGIIVGRKGTVGSIHKTGGPFYCIDTAYYILKNDEKYHFDYLYYLLQTLGLNKLNYDSAVPGLNRDVAYDQKLMLPPLPEQTAIASILSALDDKIELNLQTNRTLEEMAMTLYKHWFVDFGPFQNGEFIDSELGKIPKGWEVKKFGDLIEKIIDNRGKTPPLSKAKTEYLLFETYQLTREHLFPDGLQENKAKYVTKEIYNNLKWFRKGHPKFMDILFATVGNGIPNWSFMYENDGVGIAQNVVAIRSKSYVPPIFLRCSFESKSFLEQFEGYVIRTAQPSIKLSDLSRIDMILPPDEIIREWFKIVDPYVNQVYSNYKENQTLTTLRDTLLPKLISGEVRVKDIEQTLKEIL